MPNVKIYVEDTIWQARAAELRGTLRPVREILCTGFGVTPAQCQLAILPFDGLVDQHPVSAEIHILKLPGRTREQMAEVGGLVKDEISAATLSTVAVRLLALDPDVYVTLK